MDYIVTKRFFLKEFEKLIIEVKTIGQVKCHFYLDYFDWRKRLDFEKFEVNTEFNENTLGEFRVFDQNVAETSELSKAIRWIIPISIQSDIISIENTINNSECIPRTICSRYINYLPPKEFQINDISLFTEKKKPKKPTRISTFGDDVEVFLRGIISIAAMAWGVHISFYSSSSIESSGWFVIAFGLGSAYLTSKKAESNKNKKEKYDSALKKYNMDLNDYEEYVNTTNALTQINSSNKNVQKEWQEKRQEKIESIEIPLQTDFRLSKIEELKSNQKKTFVMSLQERLEKSLGKQTYDIYINLYEGFYFYDDTSNEEIIEEYLGEIVLHNKDTNLVFNIEIKDDFDQERDSVLTESYNWVIIRFSIGQIEHNLLESLSYTLSVLSLFNEEGETRYFESDEPVIGLLIKKMPLALISPI